MRRLLLAAMAVGLALLGWVLWQTDLGEVWRRLVQVGWQGFAWLLCVYALCIVAQAASWLFTLRGAEPGGAWLSRLSGALLVGFAFEATTVPGLGGEPVKAIALKRRYGVRVRDAAASLVLTRTTDLLGQLAFVAIGCALIFRSDALPGALRVGAGVGLALLALFVALLVLAQQQRALGRLKRGLERGWLRERPLGARAVAALDALHDVDEQLLRYYRVERGRCVASVAFAFADWVLGAVAVAVALAWLGHPVAFADAVVIEAFLVVVRSALFFVPADLGTQEGSLALACSAVTGSPELGLALSALRRARDLVWIALGLALGWLWSLSRESTGPEPSAS